MSFKEELKSKAFNLRSVTKIKGKKAIWTNFHFSPFPFLTMSRNNDQYLRQAFPWVHNSQHCTGGGNV